MYNRLKPLVLKIHAGATPLEKDSQLKQYLWERLPDQVVIMSTGHNFNTAAELRDFATELLHTMQQRPTSVINAVSQYDATPEITKKIDVLTQQIQHIAAIQTPRDNLNPQPTSGPPTIFKSRKAKQTVQRVTSQSCHRCGKMGHIARDCFTNICSRCKRPGHVASKCQACYQCGRLGHVAQFCPQNNQYSNQEQRRDTGERISRQGEIERRTFRQQTSRQHDNHSRRQLDRSISPALQTFQRIPQQDLQRSPSRYDSSHSRDITPPPSVRFRLSSDHLPNAASFSTITDIQTSDQSVTETTANGLPEEMDAEGEREEHTKERDGDDQLHNDVFEDCLDGLSDNLLDSGTNGQTKKFNQTSENQQKTVVPSLSQWIPKQNKSLKMEVNSKTRTAKRNYDTSLEDELDYHEECAISLPTRPQRLEMKLRRQQNLCHVSFGQLYWDYSVSYCKFQVLGIKWYAKQNWDHLNLPLLNQLAVILYLGRKSYHGKLPFNFLKIM